jgi:rRNA maturation endonuclease Nob1
MRSRPGEKFGGGGIVLASTNGEALPVAADQFAEILRGKGVRLVVLGACESAHRDGRQVWSGVAPALLRIGIPAVVAMQFRVLDDLAAAFMGTMYQALVEGREIDEAVGLGRAAIRIKAFANKQPNRRDWGVPVLYLRSARGTVFRPVADNTALKKAALSLEPALEHQKREPSIQVEMNVGKVLAGGRIIGATLPVVTTESIRVDQKVRESVDGVMIGAELVRALGRKVEIVQDVQTVTGNLTGVRIDSIGGDSINVGDVGGVAAIGRGAQTIVDHGSMQEIESRLRLRPLPASVGDPPAAGGPGVQCPNCHEKTPVGAKFCPHCGAPQTRVCKSCKQELPTIAKFCPHCGVPVG